MMTFHDRYARRGAEDAPEISYSATRLFKFARALAAVAALGGLVSACASAARSTALVSEVTSATLVKESSPLYRAVSVGEVTGGEDTTLISKSKLSNQAFRGALSTSLDVIGALKGDVFGGAPIIVEAEIQEIKQPNLQISFTAYARIQYKVFAAKDGKQLFSQTISSKARVKITESVVREERIRLATEGAARNNLQIFLRAFVGHSRANPARYREAVADDE